MRNHHPLKVAIEVVHLKREGNFVHGYSIITCSKTKKEHTTS